MVVHPMGPLAPWELSPLSGGHLQPQHPVKKNIHGMISRSLDSQHLLQSKQMSNVKSKLWDFKFSFKLLFQSVWIFC